ncbi:MAG: hypothetical protein A3A13_03875 [Candidatus Yanofskybacteria bacterium RIFCSPLOWO2_01_FULL_43_22]|uniref:Uncharacterized protein n=1 Tax=Candidatus Yanofskybacteria bacterium RIFCSPLOWO2_01_FULL_43_22 TaxID=1802695 RepID=A0A1F8GHU5_9BACT|nr:MAG: hypothetical protein A3D48_00425 [Candidatus Yanofskybacteria bacterium RIFCSPHIGHO2_02_FULL_43_17]OGN24288.1 MAG: hypothetical protein A3A13_03875 [Candidatus Yanofskybacteria bacterium RIFCSPLOWO2_01_FULL_43_22]
MKRTEVKRIMVDSLRLAEECKKEARTSSATADGIMTAIIAVGIFRTLCRMPQSESDSPVVSDENGRYQEVNFEKPERNLTKKSSTQSYGFPPKGLGIW